MSQPSYPLSKEEYIEKKQTEQQEAIQKLEQGVKEIFTSEKYAEFLKTYSKFHKYSINNSIMILMQKPDASNVASFQTWRSLGRPVRKGEKGIKILVPIPYKYKKEVDTNELDGNGEHIKETKEMQGTSFRVGNVFDVSQTAGKELPKLTTDLKEYSAEIELAIDAVARTSKVPVRFESDMPHDKKGYYSINNKEIVINDNMSDTQTFKTLIHEIAHSKIHAKDLKKYNAHEREVQAESVAYVVCNTYGIDTSEYSFGYIAGWSSNKEMSELKESLSIIQDCSSEMIKNIDKAIGSKTLEELAKHKTQQKER